VRWFVLFVALSSVSGGAVQRAPADAARSVEGVRRSLDRGAYAEAERDSRELSATIEAEYGPDSLELARALDVLVEALVRNGKAGESSTLALADRVVRLKEQLVGRDHLETATSLHDLAAVDVERGEFSAAVPLHERALAIRVKQLPPDNPAVADSLDHLARALIQLERFDEARRTLAQSQAIREARSDQEPLALARTLELVTWLDRYSGNYAAAMLPLDRALAIRRRLSPEHPDMTSAIEVRGDVLWLKGDIAAAESAWADALALGERTLGPEHPAIAALLRRLALAAQAFGNRTEGRRMLERGLKVSERSLAPCNPERLALLGDLASAVRYDGEYAGAYKLHGRALNDYEKCLGNTHSETATVIYNLASLASSTGDFTEAERQFRLAIRIWSTGLGPNHPYVARGIDALAGVAAARGQRVRARALYERALDIRRRAVGPDHPDVAWTLVNLASTLADAGNVALALHKIDQAIDIYQRVGASDIPAHQAGALDLRGALEARRGDAVAARQSFAEALSARERIFGTAHPLAAATRAELAAVDFALGSYENALASALDAERAGREHLRFTVRYLPERQAMAYAAKRPRGLDLALSILAAGHVTDPSGVLDALVQSRGVILDELAARAQSAAGSVPEVASLNTTVVAARQRFANLMLRSLQDDASVSLALLDKARQEKEGAERALAEQSASARTELSRGSVGLEEIRRAILADSALVSFVRYDRTSFSSANPKVASVPRVVPSYMAFVIRSDSSDIAVVPLGSAASLDSIVAAWREEGGGRSIATGVPATQAESAYRVVGARLRRRLWDPIAEHVRGASHVFVVPDGTINLVSLAALPMTRGRYLLEESSVLHYVATERDLVPSDSGPSGRGLLAVGGPAFDERTAPVMPRVAVRSDHEGAGQPSSGPARTRANASNCVGFGSFRFEDLPGSREEVAEVARIWPSAGDGIQMLTGRGANEGAVKRAVAGHQVVHFATHGFFLSSRCDSGLGGTRAVGALAPSSPRAASATAENPLLLAGLALAGANRRSAAHPDQDDGILMADEVAGLNLQGTEWAVLSACDTGLGEVKAGEGVFGLRRAFQIAGAHTVIMSLWSVDDQAARLWMRALYQSRFQKHLSTADAMRGASLTVLRARRANGQSTHPFYWGGFVAAGDWR
jgi:CHAT domain-containing protein/tetratricopeptide (TPR) repeat protein